MNEEATIAYVRACQLSQLERWSEAFEWTRRAIVSDVEAAGPHSLMAMILLNNGYPEPARIEAREALRLEPEESEHLRILALSEAADRRFAHAREAVEAALAIAPQDPSNHYVSARVAAIEERWNDCVTACRHALEIAPEDQEVLVLLAHTLDRQGLSDEAREVAGTALELDPESARAQQLLGRSLLRKGELGAAREALRESLRQDPDQEDWWHTQAVKGQSFWYRPFLRFTLFMARLPRSFALALIVGLWAGNLWVVRMSEDYPGFRPYGEVLSLLYVLFVIYTWLADPIASFVMKWRQKREG